MQRILVLSYLHLSTSQLFTPAVDIKTLSELPLERLLQVRNDFSIKATLEDESFQMPQALPLLQPKTTNTNRGSYGYGVQEEMKGGKKGIQSIFQISVTTLAFLAFGGYLLCLIVQAIKGKQNYYMDMDDSQVVSYILNRPVRRRPARRRRPTRRRRPVTRRGTTKRPTSYTKRKQTKRPRPRYKREVEDGVEGMYDALVMLSEGYTKYHTVDYRDLNHTMWY